MISQIPLHIIHSEEINKMSLYTKYCDGACLIDAIFIKVNFFLIQVNAFPWNKIIELLPISEIFCLVKKTCFI